MFPVSQSIFKTWFSLIVLLALNKLLLHLYRVETILFRFYKSTIFQLWTWNLGQISFSSTPSCPSWDAQTHMQVRPSLGVTAPGLPVCRRPCSGAQWCHWFSSCGIWTSHLLITCSTWILTHLTQDTPTAGIFEMLIQASECLWTRRASLCATWEDANHRYRLESGFKPQPNQVRTVRDRDGMPVHHRTRTHQIICSHTLWVI